MKKTFQQRAKRHAKEEKSNLNKRIDNAFHFTDGDLAANRAGFVSFRQRGVWRNKLKGFFDSVFWALFFAVLGLVCFWGIYEIVLKIDLSALGHTLISVILAAIMLFIALFFLGCALLFGYGAKQELKDLRNHKEEYRRVKKIIVRKSPNREKNRSLVSDDGLIFPISENEYEALKRKARYCLYYADGVDGPILYSIESLDELIAEEEAEDDAVYFDEYEGKA